MQKKTPFSVGGKGRFLFLSLVVDIDLLRLLCPERFSPRDFARAALVMLSNLRTQSSRTERRREPSNTPRFLFLGVGMFVNPFAGSNVRASIIDSELWCWKRN
jgi:hypothetical protein